jgi:hypothetical protein
MELTNRQRRIILILQMKLYLVVEVTDALFLKKFIKLA